MVGVKICSLGCGDPIFHEGRSDEWLMKATLILYQCQKRMAHSKSALMPLWTAEQEAFHYVHIMSWSVLSNWVHQGPSFRLCRHYELECMMLYIFFSIFSKFVDTISRLKSQRVRFRLFHIFYIFKQLEHFNFFLFFFL